MAYSFEELVQLKQDRRIGWLQFTLEGEHADGFMQWCKEHNTHPSEDTAEFYMESVEEVKQICEQGVTRDSIEFYKEDGTVYYKRLQLTPEKDRIIMI